MSCSFCLSRSCGLFAVSGRGGGFGTPGPANLDLRFVLGGGFGWHAFKSERSRLDLLGGADFNRSSFSTPLTQKSAEIYWGDEFSLKLAAATSLVQSFRMFNDLTNNGSGSL